MTVRVHLFATLAAFLPPGTTDRGSAEVEVPEGATVDQLATVLGIPPDQPRIALVNGREAEPDRALEPGDEVALFPPLAGGGGSPAGRRTPARRW
ncbi:MAG TPA: MoaD/ThiS family protein [Gemmatimonadales bacterium]|nr:MoaD/ThiS family protein [Gemmatimonadales bacterium]